MQINLGTNWNQISCNFTQFIIYNLSQERPIGIRIIMCCNIFIRRTMLQCQQIQWYHFNQTVTCWYILPVAPYHYHIFNLAITFLGTAYSKLVQWCKRLNNVWSIWELKRNFLHPTYICMHVCMHRCTHPSIYPSIHTNSPWFQNLTKNCCCMMVMLVI